MHLDSFSNASVIDLKKSMRNENGVLNALRINPNISVFDMSENLWLPPIIESLKNKGLISEIEEPYPWLKFIVTSAGVSAITI